MLDGKRKDTEFILWKQLSASHTSQKTCSCFISTQKVKIQQKIFFMLTNLCFVEQGTVSHWNNIVLTLLWHFIHYKRALRNATIKKSIFCTKIHNMKYKQPFTNTTDKTAPRFAHCSWSSSLVTHEMSVVASNQAQVISTKPSACALGIICWPRH